MVFGSGVLDDELDELEEDDELDEEEEVSFFLAFARALARAFALAAAAAFFFFSAARRSAASRLAFSRASRSCASSGESFMFSAVLMVGEGETVEDGSKGG